MGKAVHLFTKQEVQKLIFDADDDADPYSIIVIHSNGYLDIVHNAKVAQQFPVRYEAFASGEGYLGKTAGLDENYVAATYHDLLVGWLSYLETGTKQFLDGAVVSNLEDQQIIDKINQL